MSQESSASGLMCQHSEFNQKQSEEQQNLDQREEQQFNEVKLREDQMKQRTEIKELECGNDHPGYAANADTEGFYTERSDCESCSTFMREMKGKESTIEELNMAYAKLRSEADMNEKRLADFKERMSIEASAEIGRSNIFEDINNPCRESELRKSYEKLRVNAWPKYKENVKKRKGETFDANKEKETVKRMLKNVFDKALTDMEEKKLSLKAVFKIRDDSKTLNNKKQLHCMDIALQNLQNMILLENVTRYKTMNKELGHSDPDYLCEFADQCYKQGCLMALHNPPLILDWNNEESGPFPPVKLG